MKIIVSRRHQNWFWLTLAAFVFLFTACAGTETPAVTEPVSTPIVTQELSPSPTPPASPTLPPSRIILLSPDTVPVELLDQVQPVVAALAGKSGLDIEVLHQLGVEPLGQEVRGVVVLPPDPGVAEMAAANPGVPFLVLGLENLESQNNVTVMNAAASSPDQQAFLAGYIAAVLTADWRVGMVSLGEAPGKDASQVGITNGVVFFCGLCRPTYPPFNTYPVLLDLPSGYGEAEISAIVRALTEAGVITVYVPPPGSDPTLLQALAAAGMQIIGSSAPPAGLEASWVASIEPDYVSVLPVIWEAWLDGASQDMPPIPVHFTHPNSERFSPGKQEFVREVEASLQVGLINTGYPPQSGGTQP